MTRILADSPHILSPEVPAARRRLLVRGTVQGVGFRPFVYRLAQANRLTGSVANTPAGVVIDISGERARLERFLQQLTAEAPPLAQIDAVTVEDLPFTDQHRNFRILASHDKSLTETLVPVDVTLCGDCEQELMDPENRRFQYPLNNCTNCGPRYTIIRALPYDRATTAMAPFPLCPDCRREYENPQDRRFHAEATACPVCGPHLNLITAAGEPITMAEPLMLAAEMIRQGQIIAVKGIGGFHIVCDAGNAAAVAQLRRRKERPDKPFAVLVRDVTMAEEFGCFDDHSRALLTSLQRPVVLVPNRNRLPGDVTGPLDRIGLFLPYSPLHLLLLQRLDRPLVATSANIADEPVITAGNILRDRLGTVVDAVLDVNREIINGCDDSVVTNAAGQTLMLRRARGYAPAAIKLPGTLTRRVLAVGAGLKNTIALGIHEQAILSPHIGDLEGVGAEDYFQRTIATFKRLYDFEPELILCDKHPGYFSSRWAARQQVPVQTVQHHHAHALSGMVACGLGLDAEILAFCWDGTGYGDDGSLWGGEVLHCSYRDYERRYQLRPLRLLGAEQAIREPRRVALSLLFDLYGEEALALDNPCLRSFSPEEARVLLQMHHRRLNAPVSSSIGRLFDAAASLLGICHQLTFEGQSGMLMEKYYDRTCDLCYGFVLGNDGVIDVQPALEALLRESDPVRGVTGFINMLVDMVMRIMEREGRHEALLTGGVFQNTRLVQALLTQGEKRNFRLHIPQKVPVNDGGIALGQIAAALAAEASQAVSF